MSRLWRVSAVVVCSMVAFAAGTPGIAGANEAPAELKYVALGDSRAAGPRLEPQYTTDDCSRSYENFAGKIARELAITDFADVSCSAARVENVLDTPQRIPASWPVQIDAVHPDTDLVTISIGGNNANTLFVGPLCVAPGPGTDRGCRDDPLTETVALAGIERAAAGVDKVLAALTERAPHARIYLLGEGGLIGTRGCWPNVPFSDGDASWFAAYYARLNSAFFAVAHTRGVQVLDIATPAVAGGHDACAAPEQRWFEGLFSDTDAQRFHFTDAGMSAVARMVVDDLAAAGLHD
ncbi:SGNH/GDSL hydrolase family protein [Rhodococcus sp. (in: high G+C Gram-positive bacteria)]|uniref:SGNH/GDSL hydrolase family protein n=1 Tax=Rhodococcus sp. TaxID=1831 RepID=UPI003BB07DA5